MSKSEGKKLRQKEPDTVGMSVEQRIDFLASAIVDFIIASEQKNKKVKT